MKLVDLTGIAAAELPLAELRAHLRLGTGFADDTAQDAVLEPALRAALAAIEGRTGKVILERSFRWSIRHWRSRDRQALPVAPVTALTAVSVVARNGDVTAVALDDLVLEEDPHRPALLAVRACLPAIPLHGQAEVTFVAGFAPLWSGLPADLAQAVLRLAAHYYESRHEEPSGDGNMPLGVTSLIERYRTVRVLGGTAAQ